MLDASEYLIKLILIAQTEFSRVKKLATQFIGIEMRVV